MRTLIRAGMAVLITSGALVAPAARAASGQTVGPVYAKVDDGTSIALCIWYPPGAKADRTHRWPALFEMDGYQGCPQPNDTEFFGHTRKYVVVYAQIRGTGCSGGQLDLFSRRSSLDGTYVIDHWIPNQPWSNRRVGITGHSYSGLTGFLVAATSPHVGAVAVSGLIDDFYRSILYPGGIFNEGFPVLWGALLRPFSQFSGNYQNYQSDSRCRANELQHRGSDSVPVALIAPVYTQTTATAGSWAISHSLFQVETGLNAPIQINQQYQDEQTGPRGGYILWQHVPARLPKRLVLSNGQHNPNDPAEDKGAWLDCWLVDKPEHRPCERVAGEASSGKRFAPRVNARSARVLMYFDSLTGGPHGQRRNLPYLTGDWPAPETRWTRYYLSPASYVATPTDEHTTGTFGYPLGQGIPPTSTGQVTFAHGPNEARYTLAFAQTTAIAGPILLDLELKSTAPDTDVYVDMLDYSPKTGLMAYLQRGMMRASFRAVDAAKSDHIGSGPLAGTIYRPYHDYVETKLLDQTRSYLVPVEIFPLGHVYYPGDELVLDVHAPPASDPLSTYAYEPHSAPAINTILPGSTLLVPLLPKTPPLWPAEPSCNQIAGYICFTP